MAAMVVFEDQLRIPFVSSLAEFRRWVHSSEFPERGRIDYLAGQIEVDMSPEDLFFHGTLKTAVAAAIFARVQRLRSGHVFTDRTRVTCPEADLSVEPDVVFLSDQAIDSGRVRLIPKVSDEPDRYIEIEGPPDLVVEIVSDTSVVKDTQQLPLDYYRAGVRELWLIDARPKQVQFSIFRRSRGRFACGKPTADHFQRSAVLRRAYRLERRHRRGRPVYELIERR